MVSNRRPVLKLGVVDFGVETATLPGGVQVDLPVIRHPGAAAIVALYPDMTVALLRQYRHTIGGFMREIPAGCRNAGEDSLAMRPSRTRRRGASRRRALGPSGLDHHDSKFLRRANRAVPGA